MKTYKREMEQSDMTPPDIDELKTEPEKTSKAQEPELVLDLVPSDSTQAIIDTGENFDLYTGKSSSERHFCLPFYQNIR